MRNKIGKIIDSRVYIPGGPLSFTELLNYLPIMFRALTARGHCLAIS